MAIPPGQFMFPLHGFCLPACTAVVSLLRQSTPAFFWRNLRNKEKTHFSEADS
jgi:hypothetical protein